MYSISGLNMYVEYQLENKTFLFLGEYHGYRQGCQHNAYHIDDWLADRLINNNNNKLITDVYVEKYFTKLNKRRDKHGQSHLVNFTTKYNSCFVNYKNNCPFYPYVRLHYTDIRYIEDIDRIYIIDPFNLDYILYTLSSTNLFDIIDIINLIINNYKNLLVMLLDPALFTVILKKYINKNTNIYFDIFKDIDKYSVIKNGKKMSRIAANILKLKNKDKNLADKIVSYIYKKADVIMSKIKLPIKDNLVSLENIKMLNLTFNDIYNLINDINVKLISIGALLMDAYTLARMFNYDSDEVIVYTGSSHINLYIDFFHSINLIPNIQIINDQDCIQL